MLARPLVRELSCDVIEVNAAAIDGIEVNSTTATGNIDLFYDVNAPVYVLTNNLTGNVVVGLNFRNASKGDLWRIVRNSAAPGAFTISVKSGGAGSGTTIATIVASKNGHVLARYNGSGWDVLELAHTS